MDTFTVPQKTLPSRRFDVLIVGGGTAGIFAAIASARTGAKTALVEAKGYLGGTAVEAVTALHSFFNNWKTFGREKVQLVRGIPSELIDRLTARGGCTGHCEMELHYDYDAACTAIDPELFKLTANEMVAESGAEVLFGTRMTGAVARDGVVKAITISDHGGESVLEADVFIDATAYGDLCAFAGAEFTEPNDKMISEPIGIGGAEIDRYAEFLRAHGALTDLAHGIRDGIPGRIVRVSGDLKKLPKEFADTCREIGMPLIITAVRSDSLLFMKLDHRLPVSPTDRDAMSRVELTIRKNQEKAITLLRTYVPGFEHAYIMRTPVGACIRRGRCIRCDYDITNEDITSGRHFEDDVFVYGFHDEAPRYNVAEGGSYGFPYRAMLPAGIRNLYAVGMMITFDHHAHMSTRNTVSCMAQGQAAGTAAALCARQGTDPRSLPYPVLRSQLDRDGVYFTSN